MYNGIKHYGCTNEENPKCPTEVNDSGDILTWKKCGHGNQDEDTCVYPFVYEGVEYNKCADEGNNPFCATSTYNSGYNSSHNHFKDVYTKKYCDYNDLVNGGTEVLDYGSGTTVTGKTCVPMKYQGKAYSKCSGPEGKVWCATSVNAAGEYTSYEYCGYGSAEEDKCVEMVHGGVYYMNCEYF